MTTAHWYLADLVGQPEGTRIQLGGRTGSCKASCARTQRNADARGIWSDGETMWVLDERRNAVFAYDLESGGLLAEYAFHPSNSDPRGIWSDGEFMYVVRVAWSRWRGNRRGRAPR